MKNCYYYKEKYFFFFCERYCQKFHLVKPDNIFDGDLGELQKFVEYVMENKNKVFESPDNNILLNGITYEEDILETNFKDLRNVHLFFKATTQRVMLDKFQTDVVMSGGMNPWESCNQSLYPLIIEGSLVRKIVALLAMLLIFIN